MYPALNLIKSTSKLIRWAKMVVLCNTEQDCRQNSIIIMMYVQIIDRSLKRIETTSLAERVVSCPL
jgi:hypothetical protein